MCKLKITGFSSINIIHRNYLILITYTLTNFTILFSGAFVPLTLEGNMVVNGVLASCYPSNDHDLAHFGMTPIRLFPNIIECIFGVEKEFQSYVKIAEDLGHWVLPHRQEYSNKI